MTTKTFQEYALLAAERPNVPLCEQLDIPADIAENIDAANWKAGTGLPDDTGRREVFRQRRALAAHPSKVDAVAAIHVFFELATESGLDRRVFRRMESGALEWCHFEDLQAHGVDRARWYGFASRTLPESIADQETFANAGFEVIGTGGGCTAWFKKVDESGAHILITDLGGLSHELSGDGDNWVIGTYWEDADGNAAWSTPVDATTVSDAIEAAKAMELAFRFAARLVDGIGADAVATVNERNATPEYAKSGSCASHDFCDANMIMHEAWHDCFGPTPALMAETYDTDSLLWSRAWGMAKANQFFVESSK